MKAKETRSPNRDVFQFGFQLLIYDKLKKKQEISRTVFFNLANGEKYLYFIKGYMVFP